MSTQPSELSAYDANAFHQKVVKMENILQIYTTQFLQPAYLFHHKANFDGQLS